MVELLVFAPGEELDDKEFAEIILVPGDGGRVVLGVLDTIGLFRGQVRFAVRRRPGLNPRRGATANPLAVACPYCEAMAWDPCAAAGSVNLHTHPERHAAASTYPAKEGG